MTHPKSPRISDPRSESLQVDVLKIPTHFVDVGDEFAEQGLTSAYEGRVSSHLWQEVVLQTQATVRRPSFDKPLCNGLEYGSPIGVHS